MTQVVFLLSVLIGTASLAYGYFVAGYVSLVWWIVLAGGAWIVAHLRRVYWVSSVGLLLAIVGAGFGVWMEFLPTWMLLGALGALLGWDLSDFSRRLRFASPKDDVQGMERRHLARVGVVALLGGGLAYLSLVIHIQRLAFEVAVGLILLAALGVTRLILRLRKY